MLDQPIDHPIPYTVVDMPDTPEAIVLPRPSLEAPVSAVDEAKAAITEAMAVTASNYWGDVPDAVVDAALARVHVALMALGGGR